MDANDSNPHQYVTGAGKNSMQAFGSGTGLSKPRAPRATGKKAVSKRRPKKSKDSLVSLSDRKSVFSSGRSNSNYGD